MSLPNGLGMFIGKEVLGMFEERMSSVEKSVKRRGSTWLITLTGLVIVLQDSLRNIGGGSSLQAAFTVGLLLVLIFCSFVVLSKPRIRIGIANRVPELVLLMLFVIWATFRFFDGLRLDGIQNIIVWAMLPLASFLVLNDVRWQNRDSLFTVISKFTTVASCVFLASTLYSFSSGSSGFIYSPRAAGWTFAIAVAYLAPIAALKKKTMSVALPSICVMLSLSRTAGIVTLVALSCYVLLRILSSKNTTSKGFLRILAGTAIFSSVTFWLLFSYSDVVRQRFLGGDNYTFGELQINTSGRGSIWSVVVESIDEHFWIGAGTGHAQELVTATFSGFITHPHNEFLRILDDTGFIGLTLWVLALVLILVKTIRQTLNSTTQEQRAFSLGTLLVLVGFLAGCATDNVSIYHFVVFPLAMILGQNLAQKPKSETERRLK